MYCWSMKRWTCWDDQFDLYSSQMWTLLALRHICTSISRVDQTCFYLGWFRSVILISTGKSNKYQEPEGQLDDLSMSDNSCRKYNRAVGWLYAMRCTFLSQDYEWYLGVSIKNATFIRLRSIPQNDWQVLQDIQAPDLIWVTSIKNYKICFKLIPKHTIKYISRTKSVFGFPEKNSNHYQLIFFSSFPCFKR